MGMRAFLILNCTRKIKTTELYHVAGVAKPTGKTQRDKFFREHIAPYAKYKLEGQHMTITQIYRKPVEIPHKNKQELRDMPLLKDVALLYSRIGLYAFTTHTHKELAEMLGVSESTLKRLFARLKREKLMVRKKQKVKVSKQLVPPGETWYKDTNEHFYYRYNRMENGEYVQAPSTKQEYNLFYTEMYRRIHNGYYSTIKEEDITEGNEEIVARQLAHEFGYFCAKKIPKQLDIIAIRNILN